MTVDSGLVQELTCREIESLYDRHPWLYAFCREHLFRDDFHRIATSLWPKGDPATGSTFVELGCGPGFYACRMAERFKHLQVVGVDSSEQQLEHARCRAAARGLSNCRFEKDDALALTQRDETVDALVVSRLFTIVSKRDQVLAEMYRILRPGGRCFIAEPRSGGCTALPLLGMRLLAGVADACANRHMTYREPTTATVLSARRFESMVRSQPWEHVEVWNDRWYQYAVCGKTTNGWGSAVAR